jgi:hypothetical protein
MRRLAVAAAAALVLLVAAVPVGRWEGARFDGEQNDGIAAVAAAVGPLDQEELTHYRLQDDLTCLVYGRDGDELALELCFDGEGRVVEAVDRRGAEVERWSLRPHPGAAAIRVDPVEVAALRERLEEAALAEARRRLEESGG